jgi:hypothetical protein
MKISITESAYQDLADIHEHYMLEGIEHIGKKHINEDFPNLIFLMFILRLVGQLPNID